MADIREFATLDSAAEPGEFTATNYTVWSVLDSAAAPVAISGLSLATATLSAGTHFHAAQPGRFRSTEG